MHRTETDRQIHDDHKNRRILHDHTNQPKITGLLFLQAQYK